MKAMDLNNIIHATDNYYCLITIQEAGGTLIHIIPSYSLIQRLNKQQEKKISIKTEVHNIYRPRPVHNNNILNIRNTNLIPNKEQIRK